MKIAIHQNLKEHPDDFSSRWIDALTKLGVEPTALDFKAAGALDAIRKCDGAMWHWFHVPDDKQSAPKILDAIEFGLKKPVFPDFATRFHYDEKVAQHYFLETIDAPRVKTWVFWKKEEALNFVSTADYPLVFKLSVGAGSSGVSLIKNREEAVSVVNEMFDEGRYPHLRHGTAMAKLNRRLFGSRHWYYQVQRNYVYFQEFLPGNEHDIRITVVGDRAFGFIRYNRDRDFRASGSGKISHDISKVPLEAVSIAHRISSDNGFQSMAYDFLFDKTKRLVMNEISYCYQDKAVYDCAGYWDRDLKWHPGHVWPQQAHVEDFISYVKNGRLI